ncbi:aspartate racemase [Oceanobacillus limi]|uniref:Aspartate racemase n=1 Tax=Oceanobacillus limi TaxID=930131 RepID=A0A1H9YA16_9BACI|nr:aspartate/glutamate racemase family protein [Oceanobacillus limi]SES65642.1 aspartate racemase [Oceanobacillus limi]
MKTIGLIGGMSWESTVEYYQQINREVNARLGELHSAKILLYSVDFAEIETYQSLGEWEKAGEVLAEVASKLEKAGADFLVICTNTMHKVMEQMKANVTIPILHIADATAKQIKSKGIQTVGLLGTKYTMEQDFYKSRIMNQGIEVIVPNKVDREMINKVIFEELCHGEVKANSKNDYQQVIASLVEQGAEGIILGCTEIGMLIQAEDATVPLFDTTKIHAKEAVNKALE